MSADLKAQYAAIKAEQDELSARVDAIMAAALGRTYTPEECADIAFYGNRINDLTRKVKSLNAQLMGDA